MGIKTNEKVDKRGNEIGDGSYHIEEYVYEFNEYPQIRVKVDKSLTTETTYVKYTNTENEKSITVRFSNHINNAVLFGDQLDGNTAKRDEILYHLGLKKRIFIPKTYLSIWTQQVAKKKLNEYQEADKTIKELYELGEGADISQYKGKIAKGSNYLILGDVVEKNIDKTTNSLGQTVQRGEYVYSDIDGADIRLKDGGEVKKVDSFKKGGEIPNRIYLGEHGGQNVSGKSVFKKAVELEKQGKTNEEIRQQTGWFRNPHDNFWRHEVSDKNAFILSENFNTISEMVKSDKKPKWTMLSGIYNNEILFSAYPKIKNLAVYFYYNESDDSAAYLATTKSEPKLMFIKYNVYHDDIYGKSGIQNNDTNKRNDGSESRKNTLTHELQHAIQTREGVGAGSSALSESSKLPKTKQGKFESGKIGHDIKGDRKIREMLYLYNSGEIEARDAQLRINYSDKQRKEDAPYSGTPINKDYLNIEFEDVVDFSNFKKGGEVKKSTPKPTCYDFIKESESILNNGYYSDLELFYLITYNSGGGKGINVYQTVNYALTDKLAFFLGFSDTTVDVMLLKHYEEARRFDNIKILKEIKNKPVVVVDRDEIVCHNYDRKKAKLENSGEIKKMRAEGSNCIDYIKKTESILKNGYYHNSGSFYLVTYNSGGQEGLDVKQTVNMNLTRNLSKLIDVPEYFLMGTILTHYKDARRFDTIDILKELEGNKIIIADRDLVVCSNVDSEMFKEIKEWAKGGEVNKETKMKNQLSKGTEVELEHKDTIEEIASGKLTTEEGAEKIASDHIEEDKNYYDKLETIEGKDNNRNYESMTIAELDNLRDSVLDDANDLSILYKSQYGSMDIESPMSAEEKELKSKIASLLSVANEIVTEKRKRRKEIEMEKTENGLIPVKSIAVNESRPYSNWDEANKALRWIIDQQVWSDASYKIEFQDGEILEGTIDLEPKSFWDGKNEPLTWHLNTFWGNVSKATVSPIIDQKSIDFAKKIVSEYNIGQSAPTETTKPQKEISPERMKMLQNVMKSMEKEKKTAYHYVYDRLMKVAPDLMNLLEKAEYPSDVYGKSQYRTEDFGGNDAFMYLAVEGLEKDERGRYLLSISHYYKQHGDMMCDPCMTVILDPSLKTVEAYSFKMDGSIGQSKIHLVYGMTKDGKEGVNLKEKKSQNSFLNTWSSNWVKQGHKVEFRPLPEKESEPSHISPEAQAVIQPEWEKTEDFLAQKEGKASDRKDENEIKREKYPIVVEWSEGSSDENIGFENLEQLEIWLDQIGFTENPDETYIKNKVWFRGMTSYVRIDLSRQKGDFNPKEQSLIEYLIEHVSEQFDWQSLSEAKTPIVQDANFTYFKGIDANYENQFKLNKAIEEFLDSKSSDYVYGNEEKEFISMYEGYGGLEKQGATGVGLLFEYYTPVKLIEKMWGLAYKYGFSTGKVLEPSVGIGRFLNYTSKNDTVKAYEISPYSAKICRIIHPKADVVLNSFAEHFYKGNVFNPKFEKDFDLVIGNPPYGKMTDLRTYGENSRIGVSISQYEHYFILRGLDCLKSGGLLIYVSTANLATKGYEKIKEKIAEKADLVDCYLLPNTTFKQTKINTSLIVLRRK